MKKQIIIAITMTFLILVLCGAVSAADGNITIVSVSSNGDQGNQDSETSAISGDGNYVAFDSGATNLVSGDTNQVYDVFVYDRTTHQTERVSVASDGTQANDRSLFPSISYDGRYVAFYSEASNLVVGDTNDCPDIFVHDRLTGVTTRVSVATGGTQSTGGSWSHPSISADGRYVTFDSSASDLVSGDTNNHYDIFVKDRNTDITTRVSVNSNSDQANGDSRGPVISADGRYVAFLSEASNLVSGDTNTIMDAFVHDRVTGQTTRVNIDSNGNQATNSGIIHTNSVSISGDGRYVVFSSGSNNLVPGDNNDVEDVFLHDRTTGQTTRISVNGVEGNNFSDNAVISADGQYIAFQSVASNLVPGDTNEDTDVFLYDRITGKMICITHGVSGAQPNGGSGSMAVSISADGRSVSFDSFASNLVAGDDNDEWDIFVYDREIQSIENITNSTSGITVANAASNTVGMQEAGLPVAGLVLAVLVVFGSLAISKRK